ncbi:MAG: anti-sigma factor family protein [Candidatus Aminicenantales bacterium]
MECNRIAELLPSYVDGELEAAEKVRVEAHLHSCAECAALSALLAETDAALAAFPDLDPGYELRTRLAAIAGRKPRFSIFALLRRPQLQPVLVAASALGIAVSLYLLNPSRREFDKTIVRAFHRGVGTVETLYSRAGAVTDKLGAYAENFYASIQSIKPADRGKKL